MRKPFVVLTGLIFLVGLGVGVFFLHDRQDIRQRAAETSTAPVSPDVVALVGTQSITKDMVEKAALEQYAPSAITPDVRKIIRDLLIERMILDQEAAKNKITVSPDEIATSQLGNTIGGKYEVLKKKITASLTTSYQAYVIGYWVPPAEQMGSLTSAQKATVEKIRIDGKEALTQARDRLANNEDVLALARLLIDQYPSLKDTLGVNGYILSKTTDENLFKTPRVYTKDAQNVGQPFFDALYSMKEGETRVVFNDKDAGGSVIQLVKVHTSEYADYDAFLAAKKQELVKLTNNV